MQLDASPGFKPNHTNAKPLGDGIGQALSKSLGNTGDDATWGVVLQAKTLRQHRRSDSTLTVPTNKIDLTNALRQPVPQTGPRRAGHIAAQNRATTHADEQKKERTLATLRSRSFDGQKMTKSVFAVNLAGATIDRGSGQTNLGTFTRSG